MIMSTFCKYPHPHFTEFSITFNLQIIFFSRKRNVNKIFKYSRTRPFQTGTHFKKIAGDKQQLKKQRKISLSLLLIGDRCLMDVNFEVYIFLNALNFLGNDIRYFVNGWCFIGVNFFSGVMS